MGRQQRVNIERYQAAQELLDQGAELCDALRHGGLGAHAEGVRRRLGWLVLALTEGRLDTAREELGSLERSLDVALRFLGMQPEVLSAHDALVKMQEALRERDHTRPTIHRVPPLGDWTTAVWEPTAGSRSP